MKRYIRILLPLLTLNFTVSAQYTQRTWDLGSLTWNDFTLLTTNGAEQSFLQYELGFAPVHDTIDGIQSHYYLATACMIPGSSWVSADHRTPELLRYHQVVFDMLEVERRTLQRALNTADDPKAFNNMLHAAADRLNTRIASFRRRTQDGSDTTDLAAFEQQVRHELSLLPATCRPSYTPQPFGFCAYFSLGASCPFGTMGQDFTPGLAIGYGFDFSWNRHLFTIEAYMGDIDARKQLALLNTDPTIQSLDNFVKGQAYSFSNFNIGYGFLLLDNLHMQLAPVAALSIQSLGTLRTQTDRFSYTRLEPAVGIAFRYHFWQQNSFPRYSALFGNKRISERDRISLHSKVMLAYSSFPRIEGSPAGLYLTAMVGIAFGGRYHNVE